MISKEDEVVFRKLVVTSNMARLIRECEVPRDKSGKLILAGVFVVAHKDFFDRLIIDRRAQHAQESRIVWAHCPHGCCFTQIYLSPSEGVRAGADDLSNFFYNIPHCANWQPRSSFGRVITGSEATELGGDCNCRYYMCLTVLPMGDLNSVDISQTIHERVLESKGCMAPEQAIRYGRPLPDSRVLEAVYVDDRVVLGIMPKSRLADPGGDDVDLLERGRSAYVDAGLPRALGKSFDNRTDVVAWGTQVESDPGTAGAPDFRRLQLMLLTLYSLTLPGLSKKLLQSLYGLFIHLFSHKKPFMSMLHGGTSL